MRFIVEIRTYLASWRTELRATRNYGALLEVEALQDIADDAHQEARAIAADAFRARVADDEGLAILEEITSSKSPGGRCITAEEMPRYFKAIHHFKRSREIDHNISERAAT